MKNTQFGVYPFWCKVSSSSWGLGRAAVCDCGTPWTFLLPFFLMCIVYIAYMGTVVLIVKIHFILFSHCVDSEDKVYTFCTLCLRVLFTFHIYLNTIIYHVAGDQITWVLKGHNLLFVNFTFLCYFF